MKKPKTSGSLPKSPLRRPSSVNPTGLSMPPQSPPEPYAPTSKKLGAALGARNQPQQPELPSPDSYPKNEQFFEQNHTDWFSHWKYHGKPPQELQPPSGTKLNPSGLTPMWVGQTDRPPPSAGRIHQPDAPSF